MFSPNNKSYKKLLSILLIFLHILTVGPVSQALAFYAQSASFKLNSGALTEGGDDRVGGVRNIWQDVVGNPFFGASSGAAYQLNTGFISAIQPNPPQQIQTIPNQTWQENTAKSNAFDLDDYFSSDVGGLSYTVSGSVNITVNIASDTHLVSFSQPQAWFGIEKIKFTAKDSEGSVLQSNEIALQVQGVDNAPVLTYIPDITVNENDLVTIIPTAADIDGDPITYSFSLPVSSAGTWQTNYSSAGQYTIIVTATDSTGLTDTQSVLLTVKNVNRPPQLSPIADITAKETDLVVITPTAFDPDNNTITYYYSAPFDSTGKWFTGYNDAGIYTGTVTASDGIDTVSVPVKVTITNTNRTPQAALTLSKYTVNPNEQITITLSASDPDSDPMTFSLKKDGVEIFSGSITGIWTTTTSFSLIGDHTISAAVTDSGALSVTSSANVDTADPNANRDLINPVMGDFNGDSLLDLGIHNSQTGNWEIAISDKGTFTAAVDWLTNFGTSHDFWPMGGDFNGDGKTDAALYNNTNGELQVALSNSGSFSSGSIWLTASFADYSCLPAAGNFNADKYTDFLLYNKDTGEVKVALGTGTGFQPFITWATFAGTDYTPMSGDFNGDSLNDLLLFKKSTGEFKIAFSNSKEFVDASIWITGFAANIDPIISDFNGDGLTDAGFWDKSTGNWQYAISTGSTFINKGLWLSNFGLNSDDSASTGDFNGDGITDSAVFDRDQLGILRWKTQLSSDKPTDLLTDVDNGIGGKTKVLYTYAASQDNQELPFPVYTASSISLINTHPSDRAASYTQNFTFSGGYYDSGDREFRGFAKVKVTDPITNNFTETYFHQGRAGQEGALKGQIDKLRAFDGNARLISETLNTYEVRKAGPDSKQLGAPLLTETTTTVYEVNAASLTAKTRLTYDNIGNVIEAFDDGDTLKLGDEKSSVTVYAKAYEGSSDGKGFNRPLEVTLKDKDAVTLSKKTLFYDIKGNLIQETADIYNPLSSLVLHPSSFYSYDSFGNLTNSTDSLGRVTTTDYEITFYTYPEKVTNSLGHSIRYTYDPKLGAVTSAADTNGVISNTVYDSLGRVIRGTRDEGGGVINTLVTYSYPDFNTKITTNAIGLSSTDYIDGLGRKYKSVGVSEDGALARQVSTEVYYNNRGQVEKETLAHYIDEDQLKISYIRYEYDIRGRITKTISDFPGAGADAESSINYITPLYTETTDPQGHKKGTLKDIYGNIIEVTEFTIGGNYKTAYTYDQQGNLTKTTDSQGNITQIFYDSAGRKLKMTDPDMGMWSYEYDILGNLIKQTDAKNQILTFEYDVLNRLTKKTRDDGRGTKDEVNYTYDDILKPNCIGRLSKVVDQSGSTEFFYDKLGREIKSIKSVGTTPYTVERTYDILDRLLTLKYPDGEVINYNYDTNSGLLESLRGTAEAIPYVQDITYNASGQIKTIKYGNNTTTNYTYGTDLRLSQIFTKDEGRGTILQDLNYIFDKTGNVTTLTDNLKSNIRTFSYDDLDRLTQANNIPTPSGWYDNYTYQYDSIGNMTYKSDVGVMTYGEGANPLGGTKRPHAVTSAGGYLYQYDANGNQIHGKNKTLEYDVENRLISVDYELSTERYIYDGDGGRVRKTRDEGGGTIKTTTYIGSLYEVESDGKTTKHIFAGANRVASVIASPQGAKQSQFYHSDHLGSSSIITDETGSKVSSYEYEPYGKVTQQTGTSVTNYKFTGKELDNTGLYFYGARYYDPEIGRFISADTIVSEPYTPQDFNRYAYCNNNPINYTDPTGHFSWKKFGHAAAGAFLGVVASILLGPAGFALVGSTMAGIIGGAAGGALTGGLEGGGKGALIGAGIGGALGGFGAWGVGKYGWEFAAGMLAAGAGVAGATDSWDTFAGGFTGGIAGSAVGGTIVNSEQFQNLKAGDGFVSNYDKAANDFAKEMRARHSLNVNQKDTTVEVISRPLARDKLGNPGSPMGPRHSAIRSNSLSHGKWEMGPQNGIIQTTNKANLPDWGTHLTTEKSLSLGGNYVRSFQVQVNGEALQRNIALYDSIFPGKFSYNALDHNSNFAVNSIIYGAGGDVPQGTGAPGFPNSP